jgi:hypothetical protein
MTVAGEDNNANGKAATGDPQAHELPPALGLRGRTQAILEKSLFWTPPVGDWRPLKKTRNSSLRIAAIAEDRLAAGLEFEGELLLLTPQNWASVLRYTRPDLLLVESMLVSSTGHWHLGQHPRSSGFAELAGIVKTARELGIPTVFWMTKGHEYHEHYRDFASGFDLVCCADPKEVDRLADEGIEAQVLLPCVQPALYNPFRRYEERDAFGLDVLFDGWADIDRLGEPTSVLRELLPFGLAIIESRYEMFRSRLAIVPDYRDHVLGCVTPSARRMALKYAKSYATLQASLSNATTQQWMSLEAAASRVPVVHCGSLPKGDLRRQFVVECPTATDFVVEFVRHQNDALYRERVAHLGWRAVNLGHTFSHRIASICKLLGIEHDWQEFPRATLVTPTYRSDMLRRCIKTYEQIAWPNKELVLVYNGKEPPTLEELGLTEAVPDIISAHVPGDLFAGATLNMGHVQGTGQYCFRIDDDDHYGPNYITDMVLQARSIDAALFGKPSAPLIFEGEENVFVKNDSTPLVTVNLALLQAGATWIGGNSIAGTTEFFGRHSYSSGSYGAADTDLILSLPPETEAVIALMDGFNMAAERRSDLSTHTWKNTAQKLKANRFALRRLSELMV